MIVASAPYSEPEVRHIIAMTLHPPLHCCLGLDVAKAKLDAALRLGERTVHAQFDNSKSGLVALLAWCKKHDQPAPVTVLEATGHYGDLAAAQLHSRWR
jgi:hypothetical protein